MIKSYRGLIASDSQHTINLHTNDGKTGYKVKKFLLMPYNNTTEDYEAVVKIYKISQSAIDVEIDFTDNTLIAAGQWGSSSSSNIYPDDLTIIFDNEVFNQDIYITSKDTKTNTGVNYYIELEQVNLSNDEALVAIVKNLRNEQ